METWGGRGGRGAASVFSSVGRRGSSRLADRQVPGMYGESRPRLIRFYSPISKVVKLRLSAAEMPQSHSKAREWPPAGAMRVLTRVSMFWVIAAWPGHDLRE